MERKLAAPGAALQLDALEPLDIAAQHVDAAREDIVTGDDGGAALAAAAEETHPGAGQRQGDSDDGQRHDHLDERDAALAMDLTGSAGLGHGTARRRRVLSAMC